MLWKRAASWPLHSTTTVCSFFLCYVSEPVRENLKKINICCIVDKYLGVNKEETRRIKVFLFYLYIYIYKKEKKKKRQTAPTL